MKDIVKRYQHLQFLGNIGIIVTSLILAIGINFYVLDSGFGQNLKTNILEETNIQTPADITVEQGENTLSIKNSQAMKQATNFSIGISYNPENVRFIDISTTTSATITKIENTPGLMTILLSNIGQTDIASSSSLLSLQFEKQVAQSENLNLINANFSDASGASYELSTSGITF
ncbi:MAG: hypothetical protein H6767_02435 [Candidatus Peribacteria bacterium]|nr:MAG: hypothetical protein H6767_02435 [Candidatus Peribacteria bacterium]